MKKKIFKIIGIVLLLIIGLLIAAPFILEAKIGELIKNNVNNNVNATLDFSNADLSLIKSFPNADLRLQDVTLINNAPFEGDTLFAAKDVGLTLGISELFKSAGEPIGIKNLSLDGANIHVKVNEEEIANYEIAKEDSTAETKTGASEGFSLDLQSYEILNSKVIYDDKAGEIYLVVSDIQHTGNGDFSATTSELDTYTEAFVTFELDSTNYLNKNKIKLDAIIGIDLKEDKYTFLKNEALVNQLPLVFEGFVKVNENSQDIDISFKTPSSDFKNFLAVIPETYSQNISNVQTTGDFTVAGEFKGVSDEEHIPKFNIKINSENASFKYPDLPKSVSNVFIDTKIINTTGIAEDTYVDIDRLSFNIDSDRFNMVAKIKELMGNTKVNAHIDGKMNLANIKKAYPVPADLNLKGLLNADITTAFDMASIENKQYENTQTTGQLDLSDFEYASEETPNPIKIQSTSLTFNPKTVTLNKLNGSTGQTDFNATGTINNLLGFMFNDEKVEGNFDLKSNTFALNDFMVAEETATEGSNTEGEKKPTSPEEKIKIPSFLDANINASANTVLYDNITLNDVKGNLRIKDEKAVLSNMTSSTLGGKLAFDGEVSTKNETPTFAMKLNLDQLGITETFKTIELLQTVAPIASILKGKLDSQVELSGALNDDLTPDLLTLSGDVLANIFTRDFETVSSPLLNALTSKLDFIDLKQLNLDALKTSLSFKNGLVSVKPFTIKYKDIAINVDGGHTFDQKLNYKASMEVPAKYLGSEINRLIAKIDDSALENLTIPVIANIGGNYSSPNVTTDLAGGVKSLTTKLIEIEKQKLINKGKDKAKDLIGGILSDNQQKRDSTKKENPAKEDAKEILTGILGGNKAKDSINTKTDSVPVKKEEEVVKEKAKDILGGLLGRMKKKDSVD
ncbi:AsmA-like C-terminal region-containing protein [Maribacter halichondriae]|uniref:AsmA-like C-terminal region-containing protein n=1 Tax=Maribacter halichondriae TaxID=2980554 RepID=UPI002359EAF8|nr:AsmA-like C-terminal region-containing protein [Maribacter sp. Hal144]